MTVHTDCCIIGAGPAGATASLFLSKAGIEHCILDAAAFPRDKICGDGLDLKVIRVLRHWNEAWLRHELLNDPQLVASWGTRFITQNGRNCDFIYRPDDHAAFPYPMFLVSKRLHFDQLLTRNIPSPVAQWMPETRVLALHRDGKRWTVEARQANGNELEIRTPLVLGADGDHSVVLHALGQRRIERRHYAAALRQYWQGVRGMAPGNAIEVYFPKGLPMSYFYLFPLPDGEANVGFGMVSEVLSRGKFNLKSCMQHLITQDPVMAWRFEQAQPLEQPVGWGLPLASLRRRAFGDGYLLAGDAASLICPTSGEGIGTAMMSGYIAATFIQEAWRRRNFEAETFKNYDREIYRRLRSEIRLYNWMMRLSPRVYDAGLNFLAPQPALRWYFQRKVTDWQRTAWETGIQVQV
jgi:menaquinone-9 beta-reductase